MKFIFTVGGLLLVIIGAVTGNDDCIGWGILILLGSLVVSVVRLSR